MPQSSKSKVQSSKWKWVLPLIAVGVLLIVPAVYAQDGGGTAMGNILGTVIGFIAASAIKVLGVFFGLLVQGIMWVGSFQDIINAPPVVFGWVLVRDIANMFFIVVLLFIAVGTLLGHEEYEWHKTLPRFVGSIILINFSKTIAGFFIDFSQVITLTFINAIANAGEGNFANLFGVEKFWSLNPSSSVFQGSDPFFVGAAMVFSAILLFIAVIVLGVILAIFIFRLIILWFLVILFPIAILAGAWPGEGAHKYYKEWWEKFSAYLIVGPVLGFFTWLALMSASYTKEIVTKSGLKPPDSVMITGITNIQSTDAFVGYVVGVGMLVVGLELTSKLGVVGSKLAGSALAWLEHAGTGLLKMVAKAPLGATLWAGATFARKAKAGKLNEIGLGFLKGVELNPVNIYKSLKEGFERKKHEEEKEGAAAAGQVLQEGGLKGAILGIGASGWVDNYARGFFYRQGRQRIMAGGWRGLWSAKNVRDDLVKELAEEQDKEKIAQQELDQDANTDRIKQLREQKVQAVKRRHQGNFRGSWTDAQVEAEVNRLMRLDTRVQQAERALQPKQAAVQGYRDAQKTLQERIDKVAPFLPKDYEALSQQRSLIDSEVKKVSTMRTDELVGAFESAMQRHAPFEALAVLMQAAKTGDINEILLAQKDKNGKKYSFSARDWARFTDDVLVEKLGLDAQVALSVKRDIDAITFGKQPTIMETVGVENGVFRNLSQAEQEARAVGEALKVDAERFVRDATRLAYADEVWELDAKTGREERVMHLNNVGRGLIVERWKMMDSEITRGRLNKNAVLHLARKHNADELRKMADRFTDPQEKAAFSRFIERLEAFGEKRVPPPTLLPK